MSGRPSAPVGRAQRVGAVLRPTPRPRRDPRHWALLAVAAALVAVLFTVLVFVSGKARPLIVAVPAYQYPTKGDMWSGLTTLDSNSIVVVNPASGPGGSVDAAYAAVLTPLRFKDVRLYGYVDSNYGQHSVDHIVGQAREWITLYHPAGIFVDQAPVDAKAVSYITELGRRLHDLGLEVALNPGQPDIDHRILDKVDHIINFEGPLATYRTTKFPGWVHDVPDTLLWHLVYDVHTKADMAEVVARARQDGAGAIFVTDGVMPNPWDRLPSYWNDERHLAVQK